MYKVDLNCDMGESFGNYTIGNDEEVLKYISSANIACGFHASDPLVMNRTVQLAAAQHVNIGAHPGFYDLMGFGRRNMEISPKEAKLYVMYQIGALSAFAKSHNIGLSHVKLHGALYNMANKDLPLATAICEGIQAIDQNLIVLGLYGGKMKEAAQMYDLKYANEVFADRAYEANGNLVDRNKEGATISKKDLVVQRAIRMVKEKKVTAITGEEMNIEADSICIHGDKKDALSFAKHMRQEFEKEKIRIVPLTEVLYKAD